MEDPIKPYPRIEMVELSKNSKLVENKLTDCVKELVKNPYPDLDELEKQTRHIAVVGLDLVEKFTGGNHRFSQVKPDNCAA